MRFFKRFFGGTGSTKQTELEHLWTFYKNWLQEKLPLYHSYLNPGATDQELTTLQSHFPFKLPDELIELYKLNNGDSSQQREVPLDSFMQFEFLSIPRLIEAYTNHTNLLVDNHPERFEPDVFSSLPENAVKRTVFNTKWLPVFHDNTGNFIAVDLDPDTNGVSGQVINFGRDEYMKFQIAKSLTAFLAFIKREIIRGKCDEAIVQEDDGGYSYGIRPQSHLIDDLRHIVVEK